MNIPFRPPKKKQKLQAAVASRPRDADFTEEPNVKLSSAFVVVLLLHVVVVGAICAFTQMKVRQASAFDEADTPPAPVAAAQSTPAETPAPLLTYRVKSGDTIAKIAAAYGVSPEGIIDLNNLVQAGGIQVGEDLTLPPGAALQSPGQVASSSSAGTYTVVHGDTPLSIARKLHVSYDDLMRLNKIEDAKKLRIGMKLKIPARRSTA